MELLRSSGVLLHPTSLPGPYGIGDLGPQAHAWIDWLAEAGCRLWQILPLGPTGYGDSPYQCFSSFAGNHYLVSPDLLLKDGLLRKADLSDAPDLPPGKVDFGIIIPWKNTILDRAFDRFQKKTSGALRMEFEQFCQEQAGWLDDYALFMTLKTFYGGGAWTNWPAPVRDRQPAALQKAQADFALQLEQVKFRQFVFFRQWAGLRKHVQKNGMLVIGDIPIFVAQDSADVWANRELFFLDKAGRPTVIAGVPPDYYSKTGQRWGNPLYCWDVHQATGYHWWIRRIRAQLGLVDMLRIDHFRGFAAYWEVPAKAKTAIKGRWVNAPGMDFFNVLEDELESMPFIAEDLGVITPDVELLRDTFHLPGMKVLQFGFTFGPKDPFLPHNLPQNCVAYPGTHDSDTAKGWYERVPDVERDFYRRYLARDGHDVSWDMIRAVWGSVAVLALAPMQDLLSLGNEARMNYPGNPSGNWTWRMTEADLNPLVQGRLKEMNYLYNRLYSKSKRGK